MIFLMEMRMSVCTYCPVSFFVSLILLISLMTLLRVEARAVYHASDIFALYVTLWSLSVDFVDVDLDRSNLI